MNCISQNLWLNNKHQWRLRDLSSGCLETKADCYGQTDISVIASNNIYNAAAAL